MFSRAERARLDTVDERIAKNAGKIVSLLGGVSAYQALRQQAAPGSNAARWQLDGLLAEARRQSLKRVGIGLGIVLGVLFVGYLARPILFPPNPAGDAITAAQQALVDANNLPQALTAIEVGLTQVPTDTQLLIWHGVLQEKRAKASGTAAFDQARSRMSARDFLLERAQVFYMLAEPQRSMDDINALLAQQPDIPEAYYIRAGTYEALGHKDLAIQDLNRCSDLAQTQGNDTLVATARVRLGMMMQTQ